MSGRIFISYRRSDSEAYAGRLSDHLTNHFGQDNVFMDISGIELGVDFVEKIEEAVSSCDVLLAVIGPTWTTVTDVDGNLRLSNPNDFVRLEVLTALNRNIRVIPLLVQGARMPSEKELPKELAPLARRNGMEIEHSSFTPDVNSLIAKLEKMLGITTQADDGYDTVPDEDDDFENTNLSDDNKFVAPPQGLPNILHGTWQVNINTPTPFGIVPMQMSIEIRPNGTFQGAGPNLMIQGQWSISPMNQLVLAGQQSNGVQVMPYNVMVQFTQVSPQQINGYTSGNEVTQWYRIA